MQAVKIASDAEVGKVSPSKQLVEEKLLSKDAQTIRRSSENIKSNQSKEALMLKDLPESMKNLQPCKQGSQTDNLSGFRVPSIWAELASGAATKAREKYRSHQANIAKLAALEQQELQRKAQETRVQKPSHQHLYVANAVIPPSQLAKQIRRMKPQNTDEDCKKIHQNKAIQASETPVNRRRQSFVEFAGNSGNAKIEKMSPIIINRGASDIISSSSTEDNESRYSEIVLERHLSKESHLKKVLDCRQGLPNRMIMIGSRGIERTDSEYYKSKGLNPEFMSSDESNTSDNEDNLFKKLDCEKKSLGSDCQTNTTNLNKRAIKIAPSGNSLSTKKREKQRICLRFASNDHRTTHNQATKHKKHEEYKFDPVYIPHQKYEKQESVHCNYFPKPTPMYCMYPAKMNGHVPSWCRHTASPYYNPTCCTFQHEMVFGPHPMSEAHYSNRINAPDGSVKFAHISRG